MEWAEKFRELPKDKKLLFIVVVLGIMGLIFITLSSVIPDSESNSVTEYSSVSESYNAENYRIETEKRLESFLGSIEGAGKVKVYLTIGNVMSMQLRAKEANLKTTRRRKKNM